MRPRRGVFWPLLLIALGLIFLLQNFGFIAGVSWLAIASLWPLLLVLIGLDIAFAHRWPVPTLVAEVLVIAAGLALVAYSPNLAPGILVFGNGDGSGETDVSAPRGDATLVRVVFVVLGFFGGIGLLAYIVLLILMPLPGRPAPFTSTTPPAAPADATTASTVAPVDPAIHAAEAERRRMAVGYLLIGLGVVFLLSNAGVFRFAQLQLLWPLVLIGIGALFLLQRVRS